MTYPTWATKTSAIAEIEALPPSWAVEPLCALLKPIEAPNRGNLEQNLLSLSYGRIVRRDINSNDGLLPESFETYQIVDPSDIVLRLTDLQNDQRSLRVGYVTERGIITSAYLALKKNHEANSKYLYYLLHAYDLMKIFYGLGGGVRQSIKYADMKWLPMAVPPIKYQTDITDFLDRETTEADALVAKYERLLELLEEKRVALITQAVTKGLDPNVPMKDSGVEWIGEMPGNWPIPKLSYTTSIQSGKSVPDDLTPEPDEIHRYPVYGSTGVIGFSAKTNLPKEALLIARVGAYAGASRYINEPGWVTDNTLILRLVCRYEYSFVQYLIRAIPLNDQASKTAQPLVTGSLVSSQKAPCPPLVEQRAIADYLREQESKMCQLLAEARRAIDLVKERRSALITAAVTGQIDVTTYKPGAATEVA